MSKNILNLFRYPDAETMTTILQRPVKEKESLFRTAGEIMEAVKQRGDEAVKEYAEKFDGFVPETLLISEEEMWAADHIGEKLKSGIRQAIHNIRKFHEAQQAPELVVETMPGIECRRRSVPIEKVGLYIPGGTAPLFSTLLMLGIPALIAGCSDIIVCTPVNKSGEVHPALLFAAREIGIHRIYKTGGIQAIAAMTYGTASIPRVYKIFGPGNQYVTAAKTLAQQEGIAIDMPAGPSEVAVVADAFCNPAYVAADLLSQAEHGPDSQVLLVCNQESIIEAVQQEIAAQLDKLPRKAIAAQALANSKAVLVQDIDAAMAIINAYAPEHLILACKDNELMMNRVINAGSVFLGNYACESAGDYASGTNHTLPTNGFATAYSGVSLDSFVKKITFQKLTRAGLLSLSDAIIQMAEAEGLQAHANAVIIRKN